MSSVTDATIEYSNKKEQTMPPSLMRHATLNNGKRNICRREEEIFHKNKGKTSIYRKQIGRVTFVMAFPSM